MKIASSVLAAAVLSLVAVACATDPNKAVVAADEAHAADVRDEAADKDALQAEQAKDHAALDSAHDKERGAASKQVADDASKFREDKNAAVADVAAARRSFRADAGARLDQVTTKTAIIEKKAKKATKPSLASLKQHTDEVKKSVVELDSVADAAWFAAKTSLESSIAALEKDVSDIESAL